MNIVFSSLPAYGHLYPIMPLALAFAEAGHDVTVATGEPFTERLPLPTTKVAGEFGEFERETVRRHPELTGLDIATALFGEVCAEYTAPALISAFTENRPDLVVYEVSDVGAAVAANVLGIPAVAFGLGLWNPILARWHDTAAQHQSQRWTEPPTLLTNYLDPMPPSMRGYPNGIPIRSTAWSEPGAALEWLGTRPRVYVTLGTVFYGVVDVLRRAVLETAEHDVDVLVAAGPKADLAALGELPDNVRVERFVSQEEVLGHVDLVVHHGGSGTMLGALSHGLPQVLLPQGADQFFNATVITEAKAGQAIRDMAPGAIHRAVGDLLTDCPERVAAKRLQAEIEAMPTPADVVDTLISLAARPTGR